MKNNETQSLDTRAKAQSQERKKRIHLLNYHTPIIPNDGVLEIQG